MSALSPIVLGALVCIPITILVGAIDIAARSKASMRACAGSAALPYLLILALGNVFATVVGSITVTSKLPAEMVPWFPLLYPFFGVFAFQGILSNTNVSFFGKGVLSIQDWIGRARDPAVAAAVKKDVGLNDVRTMRATQSLLAKLSEPQLNTYLGKWCDPTVVAKIEKNSRESGADVMLAKALELATNAPEKTAALLRTFPK